MTRKMLLLTVLSVCIGVLSQYPAHAQCGPCGGKKMDPMAAFIPGSTTAYGWLAPDDGLEQMKTTKKPGLLYFYSISPRVKEAAYNIEMKLFAAHRFKYVGDRFVTMKCDSAQKRKVKDIRIPKGKVGMVFLDCNGKKIGSMIKGAISPARFDKLAKKALAENKKRAAELACGCE